MAFRTFRITDDGDLDLAGGRAHIIEDDEAIAQTVRSYLRTILGEWYLARLTMGLPLWDDILVKAPNAMLLEQIFARAITKRPGIRSLESLDLELLDDPRRALKVSFVARTVNGTPISRNVPLEV